MDVLHHTSLRPPLSHSMSPVALVLTLVFLHPFLSVGVSVDVFASYLYDASCCHYDFVLRINEKISQWHFASTSCIYAAVASTPAKCHCSSVGFILYTFGWISMHACFHLTANCWVRLWHRLCVYLFVVGCWHLSVSSDAPFLTHFHSFYHSLALTMSSLAWNRFQCSTFLDGMTNGCYLLCMDQQHHQRQQQKCQIA